MTEQNMREGLIRTIRYSDYEEKEELLSLLQYSYITFEKTSKFARRNWQFYENLEIRIPPEYKKSLEKHYEALKQWCYDLYEETDEYDIWDVVIKPGTRKVSEVVEQDVMFEDLQRQIIEQIRCAKFTIWVAVAWFTDEVLFKELVKKQQQGLSIEVIIIDDKINRNAGLPFEEYFNTYRIEPEGYFENIMHHKFCVIDLQTTIHGSYNWSKKAQYNRETLEVSGGRDIAEKFAEEFIRLKKKYM